MILGKDALIFKKWTIGGSVFLYIIFSHSLSSFMPSSINFVYLVSPVLMIVSMFAAKRLPSFRVVPFFYFFFLYWSVLIVISIYLTSNYSTLLQLSIFLFLPASLFLIGFKTPSRVLAKVVSFSSIVICSFAIFERMVFFSLLDSNFIRSTSLAFRMQGQGPYDVPLWGRATGVFGNPNELGLFCVCAILFMLYCHRDKGLSITYKFTLCLLVATLLLSASRGSIASLVSGMLIFVLLNSRLKTSWHFLFLMPVIFFAMASIGTSLMDESFIQMLSSRFTSGLYFSQDENFSGRWDVWRIVLSSGYILFGTVVSPELVFQQAIDNMFVRLLAQGGMLGLLVTTFLFLNILWIVLRLKSQQQKGFAIAFFVAFFLNSMTMLGFQSVVGSTFFWAMFGLVLADVKKYK